VGDPCLRQTLEPNDDRDVPVHFESYIGDLRAGGRTTAKLLLSLTGFLRTRGSVAPRRPFAFISVTFEAQARSMGLHGWQSTDPCEGPLSAPEADQRAHLQVAVGRRGRADTFSQAIVPREEADSPSLPSNLVLIDQTGLVLP
jgi:hypothetical protein